MGYTGATYQIPCNRGGLNYNKNIDLIPNESMVHPSRNINLIKGGREKRGGTAHVNPTAISGAPRIWGIYQFIPKNSNPVILTATSDGIIRKDFNTILKTGLTINKPVHFVTFNNQCIICTGNDLPQVWDGVSPTTSDITNYPTDWITSKPSKMVKHGIGASERLWAFGCKERPHRIYASAVNPKDDTTQPDFSDTNVLTFYIDTGDGFGIVDAIEFGNRLICAGKMKSYILDDTNLNTASWGFYAGQWEGGVGGDRLFIRTPNDIVSFSEDGDIYSVTAVQSYGDYKLASLTRGSFINEYIQEYIDLLAILDFHGIYDPFLRCIKFFVKRKGVDYIDTALVYFIDRPPEEAWMIHDNQAYDSGYKAVCSALVRRPIGDYKIYTGGWDNGFVWMLETDERNDNGNPYYAGFKTARLSFDNSRLTKRFDRGWVVARPEDNSNLYIKYWVDGISTTQSIISLEGSGGVLDRFILGANTLAGDEFVDKYFDIGKVGKRIQFEVYNSQINQNFFISQLLTDFKPLGVKPE